MSPVLEQVVHRLQNDLTFAASYLNSPEQALKGYVLEPRERQALIARDVEALQQLGVSYQDALGADSGAHSQQCY